MKQLEGLVLQGIWITPYKQENFSLEFAQVRQGKFTGLLDDRDGSHPITGFVNSSIISFRKEEGEIGGRPVCVRYNGQITEVNYKYQIKGVWAFSEDTSAKGTFTLKQQ